MVQSLISLVWICFIIHQCWSISTDSGSLEKTFDIANYVKLDNIPNNNKIKMIPLLSSKKEFINSSFVRCTQTWKFGENVRWEGVDARVVCGDSTQQNRIGICAKKINGHNNYRYCHQHTNQPNWCNDRTLFYVSCDDLANIMINPVHNLPGSVTQRKNSLSTKHRDKKSDNIKKILSKVSKESVQKEAIVYQESRKPIIKSKIFRKSLKNNNFSNENHKKAKLHGDVQPFSSDVNNNEGLFIKQAKAFLWNHPKNKIKHHHDLTLTMGTAVLKKKNNFEQQKTRNFPFKLETTDLAKPAQLSPKISKNVKEPLFVRQAKAFGFKKKRKVVDVQLSEVKKQRMLTNVIGRPLDSLIEMDVVQNSEPSEKIIGKKNITIKNSKDMVQVKKDAKIRPKMCSCANGIGSRGDTCPKDKEPRCSRCNDGYHLDGIVCKANVCSCNGGTAATGLLCYKTGMHKCVSCKKGYHMDTTKNTCSFTPTASPTASPTKKKKRKRTHTHNIENDYAVAKNMQCKSDIIDPLRYPTLGAAKASCIDNKKCGGVYHRGCKGPPYFLCNTDQSTWEYSSFKSCIHTKLHCVDIPNWRSKGNRTCQYYKDQKLCTRDGTYGSNWKIEIMGAISDWPDKNGNDAFAACCHCGGGEKINTFKYRSAAMPQLRFPIISVLILLAIQTFSIEIMI